MVCILLIFLFSAPVYMSRTDKQATNQTVLLFFQKTFSFMTQIFVLISFYKHLTYAKKQTKFILTVIYKLRNYIQ